MEVFSLIPHSLLHLDIAQVALKVMIIFHRAMRELDKTVMEQFASCSNGGCLIDLANFTVTNKPPGTCSAPSIIVICPIFTTDNDLEFFGVQDQRSIVIGCKNIIFTLKIA